MARWYIIHAYSGFESKVRDAIISEAERIGLSQLVEEVQVPSETVTEVKRGKKVQVERKTMPGYVLAKLVLNDDVYHLVKNTPKVTGFLGVSGKPQPISDAEAARLGLGVRASAGRFADLAGGTTSARTAIAHRVVIGRTLLREVSLLVTPADQMPWKEVAPGRQGIIGLPLAIALDAVQWNRDGLCRTGSAVLDRRAAPDVSHRLRYDRLQIVTTVVFDGKPLEFVLDSGNQAGTQLWERFRRDFQGVVAEQGTKGTSTVTQIGGATDRDIVTIPDLRLRVGGKDLALTRGNVFSRPVGDDRFHGLLGMDVLSQATEVRIDFRSMTLTLLP